MSGSTSAASGRLSTSRAVLNQITGCLSSDCSSLFERIASRRRVRKTLDYLGFLCGAAYRNRTDSAVAEEQPEYMLTELTAAGNLD
jgi:hypothetical protein